MKKYFQHQKAQNDPNGNPQRVFVIYEESGHVWRGIAHLSAIARIDEGYAGTPYEALAGMTEIPAVNISKSDYHRAIKNLPEYKEVTK